MTTTLAGIVSSVQDSSRRHDEQSKLPPKPIKSSATTSTTTTEPPPTLNSPGHAANVFGNRAALQEEKETCEQLFSSSCTDSFSVANMSLAPSILQPTESSSNNNNNSMEVVVEEYDDSFLADLDVDELAAQRQQLHVVPTSNKNHAATSFCPTFHYGDTSSDAVVPVQTYGTNNGGFHSNKNNNYGSGTNNKGDFSNNSNNTYGMNNGGFNNTASNHGGFNNTGSSSGDYERRLQQL